jgi:hypothetical protein
MPKEPNAQALIQQLLAAAVATERAIEQEPSLDGFLRPISEALRASVRVISTLMEELARVNKEYTDLAEQFVELGNAYVPLAQERIQLLEAIEAETERQKLVALARSLGGMARRSGALEA